MQRFFVMVALALSGCASFPHFRPQETPACHAQCPCCDWPADGPDAARARELHTAGNIDGLTLQAQRNNPEAQYLFAMRLYRGDGVLADVGRSTALLRSAAFLDHPAAQHVLASSYARGDGVERDERQAVRWYQLAADQGFGPAMWELAECYRLGLGVDRDMERAAVLYRSLAARSRCPLRDRAKERLKIIAD